MAIRSLKNNTFSRSLLVGNARFVPTSFEKIATVTVGSGGASDVEFTSIGTDWIHLQIRGLLKVNSGALNPKLQFNNDTANNYRSHEIYGTGSSANAQDLGLANYIGLNYQTTQWGALIVDILDYKSTNKNKTTRQLGGADTNGGGVVSFGSGLWFKTPEAITSIKLTFVNPLVQYSYIALYGIKEAD